MHDVERFDRWSGTYEDTWLQRRFFDRVHQRVLDFAARGPSPGILLDVGCGTGRLLRAAASRWPNAQFIGVDPALGMVEVARRLNPVATFQVGAAAALPLATASVDLALTTISFHHWHDQAAGVREVARVLRPGGRFLLADFSLPAWLVRLTRQNRVHTPAELRALFAQAGLTVVGQPPLFSCYVLVTVGER
jgi:ubiquinone/menaquinone biosynthesis C-methylase UbiE